MNPLQRVRVHAGLAANALGYGKTISEITGSSCLQADAINWAVTDVIRNFQEINRELNGTEPSEPGRKSSEIPRQLVFAVEEIRRLLRESSLNPGNSANRTVIELAESQITWAWVGILAGDIDDLLNYANEQIQNR